MLRKGKKWTQSQIGGGGREGRLTKRDGVSELQIAASEILRRKMEWPFSGRNCRFTIGLDGSVEVNDSAGIFQLCGIKEQQERISSDRTQMRKIR